MNDIGSIKFLGDISLNDAFISLRDRNENPFKFIKSTLKDSFVVGNLECFAEGEKGENSLKKPRLKTNLKTLDYLKDLNLSLVSIANNHVYDLLEDGFNKTINFLDENGIKYIGAGKTIKEASKPYILEVSELSICFFSYVTSDTNPSMPENASVYLNWFDKEKVLSDIQSYKSKVDYIVLLLHWGGKVEGSYYPEYDQIKTANLLLEEGADIIVGHHSHTLQPFSRKEAGEVFFSLGNFCFADIVFEGKTKYILNRNRFTESIILNVCFSKEKLNTDFIPIKNNNLFIEINDRVKARFKVRQFLFDVFLRRELFSKLNYFYFKRIYKYLRLLKKHPELSYFQRLVRLLNQ